MRRVSNKIRSYVQRPRVSTAKTDPDSSSEPLLSDRLETNSGEDSEDPYDDDEFLRSRVNWLLSCDDGVSEVQKGRLKLFEARAYTPDSNGSPTSRDVLKSLTVALTSEL